MTPSPVSNQIALRRRIIHFLRAWQPHSSGDGKASSIRITSGLTARRNNRITYHLG